MKNRQKNPSFCNVYGDMINKTKKDSFYMIECAKEILTYLGNKPRNLHFIR